MEDNATMKTPAQWKFKYPELPSKELIAEIQRDAREGMVLVEDVKPLCTVALSTLPESSETVQTFRAKHPNLFTT